VVSVTPDSGSLGELVPEPPPSIFEEPAQSAPKSASGKVWLLAAVFLLLLAATVAGLWYFYER